MSGTASPEASGPASHPPLPRGRGRRRFLRAAAAFALASVLALALCEVLLRLVDPDGISYRVEATDFLLNGLGDVNPHPLVYRQGVPGTVLGRYRLNAQGFRGPDFRTRKAPTTKRILCIGDSATACMGVGEDETWPRLLEQRLNASAPPDRGYEILNLGVPGFNAVGELGLLLEPGLALEPDAVILTVVYNDDEIQPGNAKLYELFPEYANGIVEHLPRPQTYARNTWRYPAWKLANALVPYTANWLYFRATRRGADGGPLRDTRRDPATDAGLADLRNALDRFVRVCREHGIELHLVYCGSLEDTWPGLPIVIETAERAGLPLVTFPHEETPGAELRNSTSDPHLNAAGNRAFLDRILEELGPELRSPG